ncbi:MAG: hypothetical protein NXI23_14240 [Bacteroidetes bacterium]|jgi:hypothetical protein|nr:hypothetical protein [Bacteroidota bacterium]MDF1868490.1 hypothetical protein [Saprospiraceae bacterium]
MKIAKYLVVSFCLFIGTIHSTTAQDILSPEQQKQVVENVSKFIYDLNLSERDKPAFREIIGDFFIGLIALRATGFPEQTNKKVIKALIKGRDSRVKSLLSTDQYKVYKARAKEQRANLKEFMKQ